MSCRLDRRTITQEFRWASSTLPLLHTTRRRQRAVSLVGAGGRRDFGGAKFFSRELGQVRHEVRNQGAVGRRAGPRRGRGEPVADDPQDFCAPAEQRDSGAGEARHLPIDEQIADFAVAAAAVDADAISGPGRPQGQRKRGGRKEQTNRVESPGVRVVSGENGGGLGTGRGDAFRRPRRPLQVERAVPENVLPAAGQRLRERVDWWRNSAGPRPAKKQSWA